MVQLNEFISGMFVHCAQQSCICCTIVHASAGVGDVMRERLPEMACDGGWVVSVPDSSTKEGLVSNVGILGCAESACSENG